jgi:adenine-specific DNA-methyltransferase
MSAPVANVLAGIARSCVACARCEDFAPSLPDGSVNLLWLDPPYFRVVDEAWDRAWKTEADFLAWLRGVVREAARVLAPNGSLYLFASPQMGGRVECIARESLEVLNHLVWVKRQGWHAKADDEAARVYFPQTERVIFAEPLGADSAAMGTAGYSAQCDAARGFVFEPLRAYLATELERSGWTVSRLNDALGFAKGGMASHYFGRSQWQLPTAQHYAAMQRTLGPEHLRRDYEHLRRDYEHLRRPFDASLGGPTTDVWEYETVTPSSSKHPCEKPEAMLRDVVLASSRPGDVVAEFFGGSFRMAETALSLGRRYIGCDADAHWAAVGVERARAAERGTMAMVPARATKAADPRQPSLFGVTS